MEPYRTFRLHWDRGRTAAGGRVMHHRIASPLLLLLTLLVVPEAWGAVRYVSKSGMDNPTCTQAAPCLTINHAVNIAGAGDTISIGKGKFTENFGVTINKDLTINGAGTFSTRVVGGWTGHSVFTVGSEGNVTITKLDVMDGTADYGGGGIANSGILTLQDVRVWKNSAQFGGGIYNWETGTLKIYQSEIAHNSASYGGGGLYNAGVAILDEVRIVANDAYYGGGIFNIGSFVGDFSPISSLSVKKSEISYNDPDGIDNAGPISLINTTVSHNLMGIITELGADTELIHVTVADNGKSGPDPDYLHGGILVVAGASIDLINTIVANNAPVQCRLRNPQSITPVSATGSLISDATCGVWANMFGIDPQLGPLKWNGGYTHTHALKKGSPAIDAGNPHDCESVDQRGVSRPIGGNCDIGAFEYQPKGTVDQ